ncbi:hypothetical protein TTHERM_00348710 (macronuclear) [Tetrahymena thermophila SB210]|uniref:Uncharacterized protein n=1 Tax=Tetrahymena thermophila (strain SB210) TaxID=312017 RepID=I7LWS8_TETTS|nr:hypothetical protein TTHERM_00348710 [Tetrahymena thermophila SB210]EAS02781.1 hypothetical protein TTHERM_00348710 [Tetrahymena thermophila SB210]|eukprot:XP_001023026.1 hypothetical protein TTHERM_00348710 [Tetrahymena thermophila SB210]
MDNQIKIQELIVNKVTKYNKITQSQRFELLSLVLFKKFTIKKAANRLDINYSSAKTILHTHRKRQRYNNISNQKKLMPICSTKPIQKLKKQFQNQFEIVVSQGGQIINKPKDGEQINYKKIMENFKQQFIPLQQVIEIQPKNRSIIQRNQDILNQNNGMKTQYYFIKIEKQDEQNHL